MMGSRPTIVSLSGPCSMKGDMVRRYLVLVGLVIGSSIQVTAQSEIQRLLDQGRSLYYAARFSDAVKVLSAADAMFDGSSSGAETTSVRVYLGASYYALKENGSAETAFSGICKIDPAYNISEAEFSPSIVELFQQGKAKCLGEACAASCSSTIALPIPATTSV